MTTLFDKYGGIATFHQLTRIFYQKLLDSPQVAHYFDHIDVKALTDHQTNFLAAALGGPSIYTGRDLTTAHQGLSINQEDFDDVLYSLEEALEELNVEAEDIQTILAIVVSFKGQIISA
ncbi:MAG: hemoglobin [Gammaproteobacteria bacterium]|jgi:hemoglobin